MTATNSERLLFLSLKPRFAEAIVSGEKTIELRRRPPQIDTPTEALIYASSPTKELIGACWVDDVVAMAPWTLWRTFGPVAGVTRHEFLRYFEGCKTAHGLLLSRPRRLPAAVGLLEMRRTLGGFQPPQSFRYVEPGFGTAVASGRRRRV